MTSQLEGILDAVNDEQSFLRFVQALAEDWEDEQQKELANPSSPYGPGANGWENGTIGAYLNAAVRESLKNSLSRAKVSPLNFALCDF
jgi:hypothetical protein